MTERRPSSPATSGTSKGQGRSKDWINRAGRKKTALLGQTFGRLRVLRWSGENATRNSIWLCECECGTRKHVGRCALRSGATLSCGCLQREIRSELSRKHGHARTVGKHASPTYTSWASMIQRCCNPRFPSYQWYGSRGITVCKRWRKFEAFLEDMGERPEGLTLERKNNYRGYSPRNCKWATRAEQTSNKRPRNANLFEMMFR